MVPSRMIRALAAGSLITLLAACGSEGVRDRQETPRDREETPSLAEPRDDDEDDDDDD